MVKILVVDDEAIIMMQLEKRLTAMGYIIAGMASSGEEAVAKARNIRPDLVLMDIVMPGNMNGIEAAGVMRGELNIPVIFITAYADDAIIEAAKSVRPYGYIVKPFNELGIKAAIEMAMFRRGIEHEEQKSGKSAPEKIVTGADGGTLVQNDLSYHDLPEIKTILLTDIFTDLVIFLYTDQIIKEPIFKFALEEGLKKGGRNLFAYSHSTLQKYFPKEILKKELYTYRIKRNEVSALLPVIDKCTESLLYPGSTDSLQILLDFSESDEFDDILAIKDLLLSKKERHTPVSGIIAMNIGKIDHTLIQSLARGIPKIIVSTGKETSLSFAHHSFPAESISVVPQSTIDDVVKKSLEPVVLSLLDKPISGYDIVHEIHSRYNVLIPHARIYTILHDLQEKGDLEIITSGKSKLYSLTVNGKKNIDQKLNDFQQVFQHIISDKRGLTADKKDKKI
ncbi:response regulator receiver protein [Methanoregula boonei 6A8]|jgi:CheY-like chemotaxis protein|uniref:Response regulator receiver protein n=1 Tax=Methanoregula boonei (strain DSM 21154 / JCM 14090 / 6A8) TaxID=456442 RepID=A7I8E5_METB6|nr:response regulator [Methanoregula boonei]ABS56006.1 response regulator receiver protein [Methanoregula boonei 6A8]